MKEEIMWYQVGRAVSEIHQSPEYYGIEPWEKIVPEEWFHISQGPAPEAWAEIAYNLKNYGGLKYTHQFWRDVEDNKRVS